MTAIGILLSTGERFSLDGFEGAFTDENILAHFGEEIGTKIIEDFWNNNPFNQKKGKNEINSTISCFGL